MRWKRDAASYSLDYRGLRLYINQFPAQSPLAGRWRGVINDQAYCCTADHWRDVARNLTEIADKYLATKVRTEP